VFRPNAFDDFAALGSQRAPRSRRSDVENGSEAFVDENLRRRCRRFARDSSCNDTVETLTHHHRSVSWDDRLLTRDKSGDFKKEPAFAKALHSIRDSHSYDQYNGQDNVAWRLNTLIWAGRSALRFAGDFGECGTFKGDMAWVVLQTIGAEHIRRFWLFDSFDGFSPDHSGSDDFPDGPGFFCQRVLSLAWLLRIRCRSIRRLSECHYRQGILARGA
jgi:hypothetical protein